MKNLLNLFLGLVVLFGIVFVPVAQGLFVVDPLPPPTNPVVPIDAPTVVIDPILTTTTTLGTTPVNNCIDGTMNYLADGSGQCSAYINSQIVPISFCTGNETSGPCRPDRIDGVSAALAAAALSQATGQACTAEFVGFPGTDPNTGLSYYYNVSCPTSSTSPTSPTGTQTGGATINNYYNTTLGGGGTGVIRYNQGLSGQSYATSLSNIINTFTALSRSVQNSIGVSNPASIPVLTPVFNASNLPVNQVAPVSCYVFSQILQFGSSGPDVLALTTALVREGFLTQTTSHFDATVMTAVMRFQEAHSTEILSILGLSQGTGVVAERTMAYLNTTCVVPDTIIPPTNPTSCIQPVRSGIQNGKYRYTFAKNNNGSWTVSLNNPAYSTPTDQYYVQPNYAFIAINALDLNRQNQGRFNYLQSLPGTAVGNTEYANLFGSYNNAYYDWDNMTKNVTSCVVPTNLYPVDPYMPALPPTQ